MVTTLAYHLRAKALSQYMQYGFSEMCSFKGVALGINTTGIHKLDTGDTDAGEAINAGFTLPKSDLGVVGYKRIRAVYLMASLTGDLAIAIDSDGAHVEDYVLETQAISALNFAKGYKVYCRRKKTKARVFGIEFTNRDGSYFLINSVSLLVVKLGMQE